MIRVLFADDHPLMRSGLKQILAAEPDFAPSGEAADAAQVLRQIEQAAWDVLVLDIGMPGRDGFDILREVHRRKPSLPVLILSMHSAEQFAIRAIRAGAHGYLSKGDAPSEVVRAIHVVLNGRKYISPALAEMLANAVESGHPGPVHEVLSDREFQVMCQIAAGKSLSEIAKEISLSVKTVSTYRARALEKLHMRSNAEFTRYAIQNGLVD